MTGFLMWDQVAGVLPQAHHKKKLQQQEEAWMSWQHRVPLLTQPICEGVELGREPGGTVYWRLWGHTEECFQWLSPCFGEGGRGHCDDHHKSSFTPLAWLPPLVGKQCWLLINISCL